MASIHLAEDPALGRRVALKVLKPELASVEWIDRFRGEAAILANLGNPHVLPVFDFGTEGDTHYLVMEYVEGASLEKLCRMREGRGWPVAAACAFAVQAAEGLRAAHEAGVVHRDVKPDNLLVGRRGLLRVADFGIARLVDEVSRTRTGTVLGSPVFMAPEQIEGRRPTPATDLFALGGVLYYLLGGRHPFDAPNVHALMWKIVTEEHPPLLDVVPGCDAEVAALVERLLRKDPTQRGENAGDAVRTLRAALGRMGVPDPVEHLRDELSGIDWPAPPVVAQPASRAIAAMRDGGEIGRASAGASAPASTDRVAPLGPAAAGTGSSFSTASDPAAPSAASPSPASDAVPASAIGSGSASAGVGQPLSSALSRTPGPMAAQSLFGAPPGLPAPPTARRRRIGAYLMAASAAGIVLLLLATWLWMRGRAAMPEEGMAESESELIESSTGGYASDAKPGRAPSNRGKGKGKGKDKNGKKGWKSAAVVERRESRDGGGERGAPTDDASLRREGGEVREVGASVQGIEVRIRDEGAHEANVVKPRVVLRNLGKDRVRFLRLTFEFTTEGAGRPVFETYYAPSCRSVLSQQGGGHDWRAVLTCGPLDLQPGGVYPDPSGLSLAFHYTDWRRWDRTNDRSFRGLGTAFVAPRALGVEVSSQAF